MAEYIYTPGVYNPPTNAHYTQINTSPVSDEIIKISIGKGGKVFKAITNQSNVNYIWYNKEKKVVEIWGPEQNLSNAINRVTERILLIIKKVESGEILLNKEDRNKSHKRKEEQKDEQRKRSQPSNNEQNDMDIDMDMDS